MKPIDPRDTLFARLFEEHLRPLGFKRRGRKARREHDGGLMQTADLESSTWNTVEHVDFGINITISHAAFRADPFGDRRPVETGDVLVQISLRRWTDPPHQRWSLPLDSHAEAALAAVAQTFASSGMDLVHQTATLEGIEALCAHFGPTRFYEGRAWCLRKLGRAAESAQVIREALSNAPHEAARDHAARLLQRYGV